MSELDKYYPHYEWYKNSGYGTAKHLQAIREKGLTPYYRKSFNLKAI